MALALILLITLFQKRHWEVRFAQKTFANIVESIRVAANFNELLSNRLDNGFFMVRDLYRLKIDETLEDRKERKLYEAEIARQEEDEEVIGDLEPVTLRAKFMAGIAIILVVLFVFWFLLTVGLTLGVKQMRYWVISTNIAIVIIVLICENVRIIILVNYFPGLLSRKLERVGDPLRSAKPNFRHGLAIAPFDLLESRVVSDIIDSPYVPARMKYVAQRRNMLRQRMTKKGRCDHARLAKLGAEFVRRRAPRRRSGDFSSTSNSIDQAKMMAIINDIANIAKTIDHDQDEPEHRTSNKIYREQHPRSWSASHLVATTDQIKWRPSWYLALMLILASLILDVPGDLQSLFLEEAANAILIGITIFLTLVLNLLGASANSGSIYVVIVFTFALTLCVYLAYLFVWPFIRRFALKLLRCCGLNSLGSSTRDTDLDDDPAHFQEINSDFDSDNEEEILTTLSDIKDTGDFLRDTFLSEEKVENAPGTAAGNIINFDVTDITRTLGEPTIGKASSSIVDVANVPTLDEIIHSAKMSDGTNVVIGFESSPPTATAHFNQGSQQDDSPLNF